LPSNSDLKAVLRIGSMGGLADSLINGDLTPTDRLRLHWPEYLMEGGEATIYLFSACAFGCRLGTGGRLAAASSIPFPRQA
jgi:hypothetical protein